MSPISEPVGDTSATSPWKNPQRSHTLISSRPMPAPSPAPGKTSPARPFHWHDVTTGLPGTYDHIITQSPVPHRPGKRSGSRKSVPHHRRRIPETRWHPPPRRESPASLRSPFGNTRPSLPPHGRDQRLQSHFFFVNLRIWPSSRFTRAGLTRSEFHAQSRRRPGKMPGLGSKQPVPGLFHQANI